MCPFGRPFGPPKEEKGVSRDFLFLENCFSLGAAWNLFHVGNQSVPTSGKQYSIRFVPVLFGGEGTPSLAGYWLAQPVQHILSIFAGSTLDSFCISYCCCEFCGFSLYFLSQFGGYVGMVWSPETRSRPSRAKSPCLSLSSPSLEHSFLDCEVFRCMRWCIVKRT